MVSAAHRIAQASVARFSDYIAVSQTVVSYLHMLRCFDRQRNRDFHNRDLVTVLNAYDGILVNSTRVLELIIYHKHV